MIVSARHAIISLLSSRLPYMLKFTDLAGATVHVHPTPVPSLEAYHRDEIIESRTILIIARIFDRVFYRHTRSSTSIYVVYIIWRCGMCVSCGCVRAEEASQASGDYEHPQHDAQALV